MNVEAAVFFGLCGGLAAEVLKWFRIREELHRGIPDYAKKWPFWPATLSMIGIGGLLVYAHHASSEVQLNPILAVNVGASAPLILSALVGETPPIDLGKVD